MVYKPQKRQEEMLNWCLEKVNSVPYPVTLRWLFYQAVQEQGLVKEDYAMFKGLTIRARKNTWNGWTPSTLIDDTRDVYVHGVGFDSPSEWFNKLKEEKCTLDKYRALDNIVIVAFEAEAMKSQFTYYTTPYYVSMVPFKGDPSLYLKMKFAQQLDTFHRWYGKPLVVLYFGDLDPKGEQIPDSAIRDIRAWSNVDFEFKRIGLFLEHVRQWHLPENPNNPGHYQWEALNDVQAGQLIVNALDEYIDLQSIKDVEENEQRATLRMCKLLTDVEL
jgi:hypothetical protein